MRGRPAIPGDTDPGPRARGVDQLSRATQARVRAPLGLTSCPGQLAPRSDGLGVVRCPGYLWHMTEVSRARPAFQEDIGVDPRARSVDQLSRAPRDLVGVSVASTSCPGRL